MTRRIALLLGAAVVAGFVWPLIGSGPQLDRTALALALAAPAAGAAVALAAGRPVLVMAALAGVGAYVSGLASIHGVVVPVAILCGAGAGAAAGVLCALLLARLDGPAVLVATLVLTLAGGALVLALPAVTGADSGLGPLQPISLPVGGSRTEVATPVGDFHILLGVAVVSIVGAIVLIAHGPGRRWRAIGSDRGRAADVGINVLAGEVAALAFGGAIAALSGALAVHVSRVASPSDFAPDIAALPLLAALVAARDPFSAALIATATGLAGMVVLPAAGWTGPPDAMSLALGVLAIAALVTLLPAGGAAPRQAASPVDATAPWPFDGLALRGARLRSEAITVRGGGETLVDAPALVLEAGTITAVIGPNGAGKTTLFRALAARWRSGDPGVALDGVQGARLCLLPQEGGGFSYCTVDETLQLSARRGRPADQAVPLALAWRARLGLDTSAAALCAELSGGQRRLLDLARVLLVSPNVLICDEPLAGLDDAHRAAAVECLHAAASAGLTVLIAEHDRAGIAGIADSVIELSRADLAAQPAAAAAT